jgi:hypothetical protein
VKFEPRPPVRCGTEEASPPWLHPPADANGFRGVPPPRASARRCSCSPPCGRLGFKAIGEATELNLGVFVNEQTMPHLHDIVLQLFEPSRRTGRS